MQHLCLTKKFFSISSALFLLIIGSNCAQKDEAIKDDGRNRTNTTSAFIYNMIPSDPQASISSPYATAMNTFSVKLLKEVYKNDKFYKKNCVMSPLSISRNLAIIAEATTGESKLELLTELGGQTALDDARSALSKLLYADNSVILQCADAIWVDSSKLALQNTFKQTANEKYGIYAQGLDFNNTTTSVNSINKWISQNTNNYIKNFIDQSWFTQFTGVVITSTIYFEADWTSPFDISKTSSQKFQSPQGPVDVDMMFSNYIHKTYKDSVYENVKIYYGSSSKDFFYLDIYMPVALSIEDFIDNKCLVALANQINFDQGGLSMPKFLFENEIDLKPLLENMGVSGVFDDTKCEITSMTVKKNSTEPVNMFVEKIAHKAGIKTDEEGTVAYAVTASGMATGSSESREIVLDHPFVYFIRAGETGLILFAGVVNNPGGA
jgi:serine protease inhibitor